MRSVFMLLTFGDQIIAKPLTFFVPITVKPRIDKYEGRIADKLREVII